MNEIDEIVFNVKSSNPTSVPSERKRSFRGNGSDEIVFNRKKRTLSPEKYNELAKIYENVVVHDYDDEYHMTEEERRKKFRYYEAFMKLRKCKRKFRKLDEYVKVFRLCLDCLKIVAENNGIYDPNKFIKLVLRNEIEVFGLNFPKYVGKDKKDINWEYISDFIVDYSRDPSELMKGRKTAISDMDVVDAEDILFDEKDLADIRDAIENPKEDEIFKPYDEYDENETRENIVVVAEKSDTKSLVKFAPELIKSARDVIKEARRERAMNKRMNSFVFEMEQDDFEYIERLDRARGYKSESDIPEFKGDIMSRKDYKKYLLALDVYENEQTKLNYRGKMRTPSEIKEIELKDALEAAGWNMRNLYKKKNMDKKLKKAYKKDAKREEELKKHLLEIQKRQKKRKKGAEVEFDSKKKKKKKAKKKESD